MIALGLDEAWAKVTPQRAYDAGYRFIIGYISQDITGKNLTVADVATIHAAKMDVGLVYEYQTMSALGGAAQADIDAAIAISHAKGLGAPQGVCLYTAIDFNPLTGQLPSVRSYIARFSARCQAAGYRSGPYASYAVCNDVKNIVSLLWQTYAWSNGQWLPEADIRQTQNGVHVAGQNVDNDETEVSDWGQWKWETKMQFSLVVVRNPAIDNTCYLSDMMTRRAIANNNDLSGVLSWIGPAHLDVGSGAVQDVDNLDVFGPIVTSQPVVAGLSNAEIVADVKQAGREGTGA